MIQGYELCSTYGCHSVTIVLEYLSNNLSKTFAVSEPGPQRSSLGKNFWGSVGSFCTQQLIIYPVYPRWIVTRLRRPQALDLFLQYEIVQFHIQLSKEVDFVYLTQWITIFKFYVRVRPVTKERPSDQCIIIVHTWSMATCKIWFLCAC